MNGEEKWVRQTIDILSKQFSTLEDIKKREQVRESDLLGHKEASLQR